MVNKELISQLSGQRRIGQDFLSQSGAPKQNESEEEERAKEGRQTRRRRTKRISHEDAMRAAMRRKKYQEDLP